MIKFIGFSIIALFLLFMIFVVKPTEINNSLNILVSGEPNKECIIDSDCAIKQTTCNLCSNYAKKESVNKDWNTFCPIPAILDTTCLAMIEFHGEPYCESNICKEKNPKYMEDRIHDIINNIDKTNK